MNLYYTTRGRYTLHVKKYALRLPLLLDFTRNINYKSRHQPVHLIIDNSWTFTNDLKIDSASIKTLHPAFAINAHRTIHDDSL